jgi:hypothetical protein
MTTAERNGPENDPAAPDTSAPDLFEGFPKMDRSSISIRALSDDSDTRAYWLSRTSEERLEQVEYLRRVNYGRQATARLQRVFEVVEDPRR